MWLMRPSLKFFFVRTCRRLVTAVLKTVDNFLLKKYTSSSSSSTSTSPKHPKHQNEHVVPRPRNEPRYHPRPRPIPYYSTTLTERSRSEQTAREDCESSARPTRRQSSTARKRFASFERVHCSSRCSSQKRAQNESFRSFAESIYRRGRHE